MTKIFTKLEKLDPYGTDGRLFIFLPSSQSRDTKKLGKMSKIQPDQI